MRIDAHIHFTPPTLASELAGLNGREPFWELLLKPAASGAGQDWATAERMIEDMDRAGLDKVVIQGSYWQQHETSVAHNTEVMALVRRWPDRIIGFATLQPKAGPAALTELKRCLDGGLAGVGELSPYAQGYRLDDPDFLRLVEACIRSGIPLNLHANEAVGHFYPGKGTAPLVDYYRLAGLFPELKLILAHWGGGLLFYEQLPEVARTLANVWSDSAASPLLFPTARIFPAALAAAGAAKLLYASDYPLRICPRKQQGPDFRPFLAEIEALELAPEARHAIMGDNAARLLGLAPPLPGGATPAARPASRQPRVITEVAPAMTIDGALAVRVVALTWPATQAVFDLYQIPWQEGTPFWEPIAQAAAAHGWNVAAQAQLLADLNAAARSGQGS